MGSSEPVAVSLTLCRLFGSLRVIPIVPPCLRNLWLFWDPLAKRLERDLGSARPHPPSCSGHPIPHHGPSRAMARPGRARAFTTPLPLPAAFLGDIALDEEDLQLFQVDRVVDLARHTPDTGPTPIPGAARHSTLPSPSQQRHHRSPGRATLVRSPRSPRARSPAPPRSRPEPSVARNGVIPLRYQRQTLSRAIFRQAMRHWEKHTCVTFLERNDEDSYIVFTYRPCGFVGPPP
uniref:Peptidase M12A domain-containing protein n=1 Tax=Malurus cyaneus samueli TaxID=2593467 RepID=A0A8C5UBY2_9PASS